MTIAPWRWAMAATSTGSGTSVKPAHREIRGVDAQDGLRATLGQRRLEVRRPRPVRGADLDQLRAGAPDDLGYPHATPDLDELAARDDDPGPPGETDREGERGGVVVGHERVLGAGQRDEVLLCRRGTASRVGRSRGPARGAGIDPPGRRPPARRPLRHGARPRFVWTITPVALITGRVGAGVLERLEPRDDLATRVVASVERGRSSASQREPARSRPRRGRR